MKYTNLIIQDDNTAVVSIIVHDKNVLFLKRKKPPLNWCPPCGRVEFRESLEDALKREVKEETNLTCEIVKFVSFWEGKHLDKQIKSYIYVCKATTDEVKLSSAEHSEYKWVNIEKLDEWKNKTDFDLSNWSKWIKESLEG